MPAALAEEFAVRASVEFVDRPLRADSGKVRRGDLRADFLARHPQRD